MDSRQRQNRIQLASNVFEACDYWAKANGQAIELHNLARLNQTSASDILRGNKRDLIKDEQDIIKAEFLVSSICLLCASAAGALLRPASASSPLQQPLHSEAGAYLVEGEPKLAQGVLGTIEERRATAMAAKSPAAYADFVMGVAAEYQSVLGTVAKAMALDPCEGVAQATARLEAMGKAAASGLPAPAGVLAASTGNKFATARSFAEAGFPEFIALESTARMLETSFAKQRDDLSRRQAELQASQEAERLARNQRMLTDAQAQARLRSGLAASEQR